MESHNNAKITKLKQEGRIPLQAKALETEEKTKDIAETQLDETSQDKQQDTDMTTEGGVAKRSVDPGISPQKKRIRSNHFMRGSAELKIKEKETVGFWPSLSQSKAVVVECTTTEASVLRR